MHIQQNISLKSYNTFGIESEARYFVSVAYHRGAARSPGLA